MKFYQKLKKSYLYILILNTCGMLASEAFQCEYLYEMNLRGSYYIITPSQNLFLFVCVEDIGSYHLQETES